MTISDCYVSGYDKGSVLDGTWQLDEPQAPDHGYRTGRIKLGTESSGGFRNIAITNCIFEHCQSPKEYLTDFRMKQACYLLEHSNLSITAIANSVGFDNGLYFSKTFHKKKGASPKAYRIKIRGTE